jgi:NADPH-dependent 7-cyano-7-deazaguanine reductase QueF-like protein
MGGGREERSQWPSRQGSGCDGEGTALLKNVLFLFLVPAKSKDKICEIKKSSIFGVVYDRHQSYGLSWTNTKNLTLVSIAYVS